MLDEFIEFEEYTCIIDKKTPRRMCEGNIAKLGKRGGAYRGLPRALRIISRYYYYENNFDVSDIIKVLNVWCGFEDSIDGLDEDKKKHMPKEMYSWLPHYLEDILVNDKYKKSILIRDLPNRCKFNWNRDGFNVDGTANDINSIYFTHIVADAIEQGPLQKKYLVLEKNPIDEKKSTKKVENDFYDKRLKLVAAYLLNKRDNSDYARVDFAAYSNWVKSGCDNYEKATNRVIPQFLYHNKGGEKTPVVHEDYIDGYSNNTMIRFDDEWLDTYRPRLVTEEEVDRIKNDEGICIFEDKGCRYPLQLLEKK